jgi:serine/threonine protein kinase
MWGLGMTLYEIVAERPTFDSGMPLGKLLRAIGSDERPEVPGLARMELADVIRSCWRKEPRQRMTIVEIVEKLSRVRWRVVEGADAKAHLGRFPLDDSSSKGELLAALAERDRRIAARESENVTLKSELSERDRQLEARESEVSTLKSGLSERDRQ